MQSVDTEGPVSIKEILAQLEGRFPMDEAVVEGNEFFKINQIPVTYADFDL